MANWTSDQVETRLMEEEEEDDVRRVRSVERMTDDLGRQSNLSGKEKAAAAAHGCFSSVVLTTYTHTLKLNNRQT
jgi:hypothetical protein